MGIMKTWTLEHWVSVRYEHRLHALSDFSREFPRRERLGVKTRDVDYVNIVSWKRKIKEGFVVCNQE